ncbi:MAG: aminotransferase class V-fold PLP-dependent enzyme [bacterium]|nr:aminotransferase class V-fold PLP-dependent enzyme [bacterium]
MLLLDKDSREALWHRLIAVLEDYVTRVDSERVTPELDPERIRALLAPMDFEQPRDPLEALEFAAENLWRYQAHAPHPRYYGLFNPAPTTMGIAADALVAGFNPQLAAWSHSPFAAEVERHLIGAFGQRFGYKPDAIDGVFCSGGAEANHTALLGALTRAFPDYGPKGARGLRAQPVFYASAESHHSFLKAARTCGIGGDSLREIEVDSELRMSPAALRRGIAADRAAGHAPFLVVATAGTTNAGVIDPIPEIADIAEEAGLWLHADAAWGGAAALAPELKGLLDGIHRAHSITFDAHKWVSVPMGAGLYITRDPEVLSATFSTPTAYMPKEHIGMDVIDPHLHSIEWSRRFIGLKVFLSLMVAGWEGYAAAIRHMTAMGDLLRTGLTETGWEIVNHTPLPVVCFTHSEIENPQHVVNQVVNSGEAWISTTSLAGRVVLRACITNYRTGEADIRALVDSVNRAREPRQQ